MPVLSGESVTHDTSPILHISSPYLNAPFSLCQPLVELTLLSLLHFPTLGLFLILGYYSECVSISVFKGTLYKP